MSDITINYKGNAIATMDASGTKTLLTDGKYCEDDIEVVYVKPGGGTPNLQAKTNINATTSSQTITADEGYDGLSSVQINALDGQAAQTIHPSTSDQTIASGKYLTGAQTVKGVLLTNLDAGNIKKDVVVKIGDSTDDDCVTSVTGTYEGGGGGPSVLSGNFTLAEDAAEYVISDLIGTTKTHIFIKVQGSLHNGKSGSYRTVLVTYFEWGAHENYFYSNTNSGGTATYAPGAGDTVSSSNNVYFDRTLGKVTVKSSTTGKLYSGATYDWFAW